MMRLKTKEAPRVNIGSRLGVVCMILLLIGACLSGCSAANDPRINPKARTSVDNMVRDAARRFLRTTVPHERYKLLSDTENMSTDLKHYRYTMLSAARSPRVFLFPFVRVGGGDGPARFYVVLADVPGKARPVTEAIPDSEVRIP